MNEYWGELSSISETDSGIIAVERAEITKIKVLNEESFKLNFNYIQNNDKNEENECINVCVSDVPIGNPLMIQTIKLMKIIKQLNNNTNESQLITRESLPQMVEYDKEVLNKYSVPKINGKNISKRAVKELIRRSLILISVFYGYENTNESTLDLLVDITAEYLSRMCQSIRSATDAIEMRSSNDFIDVIDRVFHDLNVPDFESLRQYDLDLRLYNQNIMKEVIRKIGVNQTTSNSIKTNSSEISLIVNTDKSPILSVPAQSDTIDFEPTLSLRSLLNYSKSDELQESNEEVITLMSPINTIKLKPIINKNQEN